MQELIQAIGEALGNGWLLLVYGIALLLGFFLLKGKRKLFMLPAVIVTIMILNPLTKTLWEKINDYGYWRVLWIIPLIPVLAAVPAALTEQTKKWHDKVFVILLAVAVIAATGSFIYGNQKTSFSEAQNADKLPQEVAEIGEILLELDDDPRIVADHYIATYIREYSGKIKTPYGRDLVFETPTQYAKNTSDYLFTLNMAKLIENMRAGGYSYLVTNNLGADRYVKIEKAGFEYLGQVNEYGIYELK